MSSPLENLPLELLAYIVSYSENAKTLACIASTCKKLHQIFQSNEGYRAFFQRHFPLVQTPPRWKDATHGLTTLSRAWDRKSVVARYLRPPEESPRPRIHNERRPGGQTMGYQPVIDSYGIWTDTDWKSRREVVAWGAGAELTIRVKWMGPKAQNRDTGGFDQHHHQSKWWRVVDPLAKDGQDDITAVQLLREHQKPRSHSEYIIVGRASGKLDMLSIDHHIPGTWKRESHYSTEGQHIRSMSVNSAERPLLAACMNDRTVAIYPVIAESEPISPLGLLQIAGPVSVEPNCVWCTVFLRQDRLAVGVGLSIEPILIFDIRSDEIPTHPIRKFSLHEKPREDSMNPRMWSISTVVPLPRTSSSGALDGDLFLSGGHDGVIRLHDLRSLKPYVGKWIDPVDQFSSIYSILPLGNDRFLVGGSNHALLKVFNLRSIDRIDSQWDKTHHACHHWNVDHTPARELDRLNWNLFLNDRGPNSDRSWAAQRRATSPVYSLSSPNPAWPTIFAGLEGQVVQLDFTSVRDRFCDPIYSAGSEYLDTDSLRNENKRWDPHREVICLSVYEQVSGQPVLRYQAPLGEPGDGIRGWDERWKKVEKQTPWDL